MLQSMRIKLTRKRQKILVQSVSKKKKKNKEIYKPYDKKEHLQVFSNGEFQIDHSKRRNDREGLLGRNPGKYNHHPAHRN